MQDYELTESVSVLDFGPILIGSDSVLTVKFANTGKNAVFVRQQSVSGKDSADFLISRQCAGTIAAATTDSVSIRFRPASAGQKDAELKLQYDDLQAGQVRSILLRGSGYTVAVPVLRALKDTINFDTVTIGNSALRMLSVTNAGAAPLMLLGQSVSGADAAAFVLNTALPLTLQPNETRQLEYRFQPQGLNPAQATATLASNDPVNPAKDIVLLGQGVAVSVPIIMANTSPVTFTNTEVGKSSYSHIDISNAGDAPLRISGITFDGPCAAEFSVSVPGDSTILPSKATQFQLRFSPVSSGARMLYCLIYSNDPATPVFHVNLTANALPNPVDDQHALPPSTVLEQNIPNPVAERTVIRYSVAARQHISLKVYDAFGREVASLVDEMQDAGMASAAFNAASLQSGVYFYRLTAGNSVSTRKLVVQR